MAAKNCGNQVTPALSARHTSPRGIRGFTRASICALFPLLWLGCNHSEKLDLNRLKLPPGFHISVFAAAPNAREMAFSPGGVLIVTDTSDGTVLALPVLSGLNAPHGIAFHKGKLYIAEINAVRRYDWNETELRAANSQKIAD